MMEIILGILSESYSLFVRMSPYLLVGFLFAGILHIVFSFDAFARHLGKRSLTSVLKAVVLGIPLPLCSCGVIPSAILLKKKGASRGSVLAFLVATPITGIDSIFATYALLGWFFAIFRIVASSITAIVTGVAANILLPKSKVQTHIHNYPPTKDDPSCCHEEAAEKERKRKNKIVEMLRYAFIELLDDVWKWLVIGVVVGGAISYLMPASLVERYLGGGFSAMLVMLAVGIPMYICSTGSIPIAAALMMKGMSPGAALVFLLAGPATNAVTVTVVAKELGKGAVVIYLLSLSIMSIIMGYLMDVMWNAFGVDMNFLEGGMEMLPRWLEVGSAVVLGALIVMLIVRNNIAKSHKHDKCCH